MIILDFLKSMLRFLFISLPLTIAGVIILFFYLPVHRKIYENGALQLPKYLRWFDCYDLYDKNRDISVYLKKCAEGFWSQYNYIAWRNPINYFSYTHLGMYYDPTKIDLVSTSGSENVGDASEAGFYSLIIFDNRTNKDYYEYYWVYRYPFMPNKCLRVRFGWKIGGTSRCELCEEVFVISPFHTYSGR